MCTSSDSCALCTSTNASLFVNTLKFFLQFIFEPKRDCVHNNLMFFIRRIERFGKKWQREENIKYNSVIVVVAAAGWKWKRNKICWKQNWMKFNWFQFIQIEGRDSWHRLRTSANGTRSGWSRSRSARTERRQVVESFRAERIVCDEPQTRVTSPCALFCGYPQRFRCWSLSVRCFLWNLRCCPLNPSKKSWGRSETT